MDEICNGICTKLLVLGAYGKPLYAEIRMFDRCTGALLKQKMFHSKHEALIFLDLHCPGFKLERDILEEYKKEQLEKLHQFCMEMCFSMTKYDEILEDVLECYEVSGVDGDMLAGAKVYETICG